MQLHRGALNWRWAVVAIEVLVAGGCFFAGWRLVANHASPPIQVQRGTPLIPAVDPFSAIPGAAPKPATQGAGVGMTPTGDLLDRLHRDDLASYRTQWQVIQLLVDGTRQYIERRVLPALLPG